MIYKDSGYYLLQCDYCSNVADEFDCFDDAVMYKRGNGWKSKYLGDDYWADICPNCIEKGVINGKK